MNDSTTSGSPTRTTKRGKTSIEYRANEDACVINGVDSTVRGESEEGMCTHCPTAFLMATEIGGRMMANVAPPNCMNEKKDLFTEDKWGEHSTAKQTQV